MKGQEISVKTLNQYKEPNGNSETEKYKIWNKKLSDGLKSRVAMTEKRVSET